MNKNEIKAYFKKNPSAKIKSKELSRLLNITKPHDYAHLKALLFKLAKEGYLEKIGKRYRFNAPTDGKLVGRLQINGGGTFGFVIMQSSNIGDIFIAERNLGTAFNGDMVEVALFARQKGKSLEGQVVGVIKRRRTEVAGVLKKTPKFFFVKPDDEDIHRDIYIPKDALNGAVDGDKVIVCKLDWQDGMLNPEGEIQEVLGKAGSYDAEIAALAMEFNLSYKFPDAVLREVAKIPEEIPATEIANRLDLRNEEIFTIDPETAKDFDDAVSIKSLENGNFEVGIHIADVGYYLPIDSELFEEAAYRATSVYFVGKVIPMLPEKLSNGVCSLVPHKDRLTFSVFVELTTRCKIVGYKIAKTIINSKHRFTYEQVQEIIEEGEGKYFSHIFKLNKLAKTLKRKRTIKGSINFSSNEVEFELDDNGKPLGVKTRKEDDSHALIEEFMLLANQIVAGDIKNYEKKSTIPYVYRIHDKPNPEKLNEFAGFVKSFGYKFEPGKGSIAKQFQFLFEQIKETEESAVISEVAIRSMAKAEYSIDNIGHFGLAFGNYTHFTSPIRRFPDLLVHKILFHHMQNKQELLFNAAELDELCKHSSEQERNAVNAERRSIKIKQIEFLKDKLGWIFPGIVSGVTNYGMFIQLKESLAEGLVRLKDMDDDYYLLDEKNYLLFGEVSKKVYRLGDKVEVKLIRVDEEKRCIDFVLLS